MRSAIKEQSGTGVRMEKSSTVIFVFGSVTGESNPVEVMRNANTTLKTTGAFKLARLLILWWEINKAEICSAMDLTTWETERR